MSGPAEVTIRAERDDDLPAIRRVVTDAFESTVEADLVDRIRASPEYVPEMALVAVVAGEVVGHVMVSDAQVRDDDGRCHRIVMLSPLAVAPAHQGRGIGAALVAAVTRIADARGEPFVVLEGLPRYYPRLGFEPAGPLGLRLPLPEWAPAEAAQVLRLSAFDPDDPRLRGDVVYGAAFDGLE